MQAGTASVMDTIGNLKPWLRKITSQAKSSDSKYFTTTKKGEIFELKSELCSDKMEKRKEAVKKVIASMTVGKDVSALFPDVINCMQTDNVELKKLVHLYIVNYAKTQPSMAIMAVNTFAKDCEDPNPLIRALAVRTMGSIKVDTIPSYLCDPLRKCLKDEDPYVRKTAALCVAKLHDTDPQLVEDSGFIELLRDLLCDGTPLVVANAVAAISEIREMTTSETTRKLLAFDKSTVTKLLTALNECTEWGQISILDAIANYDPEDTEEASLIISRVQPRLAHTNAAVVLSTVRIIMRYLELFDPNSETVTQIVQKLTPPLITLLSAEPEIQYVTLRNISLIAQKRSSILQQDIKVFFVKYNDPIYVKLEKLDIMIRLITPANFAYVLAEFKEYANEVDVDIVRKAVRAIGRCAIKIDSAADRCIETLVSLIQTKVNYVVQEAIVVIKDIFRKYPNKYEGIVSSLCDNLDTLDEPEARASMIWIIGEYAERIDNADELLESFLQGFQDENPQVQLQLLTAIVKLFLKKPQQSRELVQTVLAAATQESENPDLRDRGYIYWRLLSTDPNAAKEVVLCEKPLISEETDMLEPTLLDELICHLSSLASVYHLPPSSFVDSRCLVRQYLPGRAGTTAKNGQSDDASSKPPVPTVIPTQETLIGDLLDMSVSNPSTDFASRLPGAPGDTIQADTVPDLLGSGLDELLYLGPGDSSAAPSGAPFEPDNTTSSTIDALADIFGAPGTHGLTLDLNQSSYEPPMDVWLQSAAGKSLEVKGTFSRASGTQKPVMKLQLTNYGLTAMSGFAIQFDKNSFGLVPEEALNVPALLPNQPLTVQLRLNTNGPVRKMDPLMTLQVAIKNNVGVFYFKVMVPLHVLFVEDGELEKQVFLDTWRNIPAENEQKFTLNQIDITADVCSQKLRQNNVFTVAKRNVDGHDMLYLSVKLTNQIVVLAELKIQRGNPLFTLSLKSRTVDVYPDIYSAFDGILRH